MKSTGIWSMEIKILGNVMEYWVIYFKGKFFSQNVPKL